MDQPTPTSTDGLDVSCWTWRDKPFNIVPFGVHKKIRNIFPGWYIYIYIHMTDVSCFPQNVNFWSDFCGLLSFFHPWSCVFFMGDTVLLIVYGLPGSKHFPVLRFGVVYINHGAQHRQSIRRQRVPHGLRGGQTRQCVDGYPVSGTVGCWWTGGLSHPLNASPGHLTWSQQKEPFHDNYRPCGHAFSFQKQGCPSNPICNFCNFGAYTLAQRAQAQVWNNGPPVTRFEPALRSMADTWQTHMCHDQKLD